MMSRLQNVPGAVQRAAHSYAAPLKAEPLAHIRFAGSDDDDDAPSDGGGDFFSKLARAAGELVGNFKKGVETGKTGSAEPQSAGDPQKLSAFFAALDAGKTDKLNALLEGGISIDATDDKGRTVLMRAATGTKADVVKWVLSKEPTLDAQDKRGRNALMLALTQQKNASLRLAIVSELAPKFVALADQRSKKIIEAGFLEDTVKQQDESALEMAIRLGQGAEIAALKKANWPINQDLALYQALAKKDNNTLKILLAPVVDTTTTTVQESPTETVLPSIEIQETQQALALAHGFDGQLIHVAAATGNVDAIDILKASGANLNDERSKQGTPLIQAVAAGQLDAVKKLLSLRVDDTLRQPETLKTPIEVAQTALIGASSSLTRMAMIADIQDALTTYRTQSESGELPPIDDGKGDKPGDDGGYDGPLF